MLNIKLNLLLLLLFNAIIIIQTQSIGLINNKANRLNSIAATASSIAANKKQNQKQTSQQIKANSNDDQLDQIERNRLIELFKEKLLEILNIKDLALNNGTSGNDSNSQKQTQQSKHQNIPEPVLEEYRRVVKEIENRKQIQKLQLEQKLKTSSSSSLSNSIVLNDQATAEIELQIKKNNEKDEEARFKSIVEEITLFPKYVNKTSSWCNEKTNEKNLKFQLIGCFDIELENKEFYEFDVNNARLYMRLTKEQVNQLNYLFIEINGDLVKKVRFESQYGSNSENIASDDGIDNNDDDDDNQSIYEYIDLKELITNLITKTELENNSNDLKTNLKLNIKFLNLVQSNTELEEASIKELFNDLNEQIALIVKFGERTIKQLKYYTLCEKSPNLKYCNANHNSNNETIQRMKRSLGGEMQLRSSSSSAAGAGKSAIAGGEKKLQEFLECSEVKKSAKHIAGNRCCRETINISFAEIGWSNWIKQPPYIEFKYCRGSCASKLFKIFL